ncbi:UDP-glucosyl transferase family protein [Fusarium austroafricanum]|uniref:UDP-glucosyl transferase family protein n=1 Tax=Fusarium austroafricanum TaxID=2364996 RepID=A0A8H4P012_9HYPO|nr:UDP-glucosyl transferase family protein [Fusarium austroafricanum]
MSLPKAKILVVVTVGGSTNSAPILEICSVLSTRGHIIDFATLSGREKLVDNYPFVQTVHVVGPAISPEQDEEHYVLFSRWNWNTAAGKRDIVKGKMAFDAFWPSTYRGLKEVITTTKPDFIFSDFHVEAALDVCNEFRLPHAVMWPQMPWLMMPQKYIPGQPGMQQRCLTSEHASIYDRLFEMTFLLRSAPYFLRWVFWTMAMRRKEGVPARPKSSKPDYLVFLNNFYGMETPRDAPPLVHPVGPILADSYPALEGDVKDFVETHKKVALVAFGTHVILEDCKVIKIINGLADAIHSGVIDAVVWALSTRSRGRMDTSVKVPSPHLSHLTLEQLFDNKHSAWHFSSWAPQRSLLKHDSTVIFVTHAGPSSVNESIFHGVPMVAMGIFGDQMITSLRIERSGVAVRLDKESFDAAALTAAITSILISDKESFRRNIQRMQRIAIIGSRKKNFAADLVEEHLYDWDGRFEHSVLDRKTYETPETFNSKDIYGRGQELRPMHLQTPDVRMSWIKLNNIDIALLSVGTVGSVAALIYVAISQS